MSVSEPDRAKSHASREFHLRVDSLAPRHVEDPKTGLDLRRRLVVPDGVSLLVAPPGGPPQLSSEFNRDDKKHTYLLEPVVSQQQMILLLIGQAGNGVRINGQLAPCPAVLREKDQVQIDDELLLHVTLYRRPQIARVPDEFVGHDCPLCRVPFVAGTRVYACAVCNSVMHLQGDEEPEETRLECALTATECAVCRSPIEMTEGYRYEPELYSDI